MATIALAAVGAAVGGALLPTGISVLGTTIAGAAIGSQVGALAGAYVDQALFASSGQPRTLQGPRLQSLHGTASTEGTPIPRIYGRCRLGGQIIWATDIEEEAATTTQSAGRSKGGARGSRSNSQTTTQVTYSYFANFAIALAEGEISGIGRVWADGQELDLGGVAYRLHVGDENQSADSLIVAHEGGENAPAYRGIAYIVFEHFALAPFGNRIPQFSFEVHRAVDTLRNQIRGVVVIPGSGEFAYATEPVTRLGDGAQRIYENVHTRQGGTDWHVGIDQMQATLPNVTSVSLVVSWFGTDLRAQHCQVKPAVELSDKDTAPSAWRVAGIARSQAHLVSLREGRPAYGGTPSDDSVIAAVQDLKARGIAVTLNPFILMDVPDGNALTDPYTGASSQPTYPWRGRITLDPAPGRSGTPDKTSTAAAQIASFVGTATYSDFHIVDGSIAYTGPDEWTFRRQILHCAWLARAAGGVDAFVIGSELRGLTQARASASAFPFVTALADIANEVRAILGATTKITYAADWTEYFGHQPADGSGDVYFHLDPLWSSSNIDAIGIDLYWPLADWRDGTSHADLEAGARSIYDLDYLKANLAGGEGYEWYYASPADRVAQIRTPITDGSGKPWVFRTKDLKNWWLNQHFDRPGGIEASTPTAWVPQMKPVWIMECGCPAVDKGANQPNVFVDPKSSENAIPYFSSGRRNDLIQRRYLQALIEGLDPDHPDHVAGINPLSTLYGGRMIDTARTHVYTWDARPYPAFPDDLETWGDGANWKLGHWLNGRLSSAPLSELVAAILDDHGFPDYDVHALEGVVAGYVIDRIMPARDALQPLELAYFFDSLESEGLIAFRHRGHGGTAAVLTEEDLVEDPRAASSLTLTRGQESELPTMAKLAFVNADGDYRQSIAEARRLTSGNGRIARADLPIAMSSEQANAIAETWLYETWTAREKAQFTLPPSSIALEPGDLVRIDTGGRERLFRIIDIAERGEREIGALALDEAIYQPVASASRRMRLPPPPIAGLPIVDFLDLPLLRGDEAEETGYLTATQSPWPAAMAFYNSPENTGFRLAAVATAPATSGNLLQELPAGPPGRLDRASNIRVKLDRGQLYSSSKLGLLGGSNTAAIQNATGEWEIIQFETASLTAPSTYTLSNLLRGQAGTEAAMSIGIPAGARFMLIDAAVTPVPLTSSELGLPLRWRYGPAARNLGEESYAERAFAFRGVARRPLSPVHVRGTRTGSDLTITWIRRTRRGGDSWETVEVPLSEPIESYEVDILDGDDVVRTISTSTPRATYTGGQQSADFGAAPSTVGIRVYQLNSEWGRGSPAAATI